MIFSPLSFNLLLPLPVLLHLILLLTHLGKEYSPIYLQNLPYSFFTWIPATNRVLVQVDNNIIYYHPLNLPRILGIFSNVCILLSMFIN